MSDGQLRFIGLISMTLGRRFRWSLFTMRKWLLPEAIEDVLPAEAARVEALRRTLLDQFRAHGYRLVAAAARRAPGFAADGHRARPRPPDVQDGRSAVGPDARAFARTRRRRSRASTRTCLNEAGVTRLCYAGSVSAHDDRRGRATRAKSCRSAASCTDIGGIAADREVMQLLLSALARAGASRPASRPRPRRRLSRAGARRRARRHRRRQRQRALQRAARQGCRRPCASSPTRCRKAPATRCARWPRLYGPAQRNDCNRARRVLPALPEVAEALDAVATSPPQLPASTRSTSISPTCAAITTTRAPRFRCSRQMAAARSSIADAAAAMMAWAARSAARGPPRASRWTCGGSRC